MQFEEAYKQWLSSHVSGRQGERKKRIESGLGHAEYSFLKQVWWGAVGNFAHLHPEYEVIDYREGSRYLDFAYVHQQVRIAIEIMGYGPHLRHASRHKFSDDQCRIRHLTIDGWLILPFAYQELEDRPRQCQQELLQMLGKVIHTEQGSAPPLSARERDLLRAAIRLARPFTPVEMMNLLGVGRFALNQTLQALSVKRLIQPVSGTKRIRSYVVQPNAARLLL